MRIAHVRLLMRIARGPNMDGHDHTAEFEDSVATTKSQARRRVWIVYETRRLHSEPFGYECNGDIASSIARALGQSREEFDRRPPAHHFSSALTAGGDSNKESASGS